MSFIVRFASRLVFVLALLATACSDRPALGQYNGACFPDNTCVTPLVCVSRICVRSDGGMTDAPVDAVNAEVGDGVVASDSMDIPVDIPLTFRTYAPTMSSASACEDLAAGMDVPGVVADNATSAQIALPFDLQYFGRTVRYFSMASNGFLQVWPDSTGAPASDAANAAIPTAAIPNGVVAPFWDDLVVMFSNARMMVSGAAPNRHFTVQWGHWTMAADTLARQTFQVKLFETTNVIEFHYCAIGSGSDAGLDNALGVSATIGLEDLTGSTGLQHSFNTANAVASGSSLVFTPTP